MNELLRELAPITPAAWSAIETEAKRALSTFLAARKLVDFSGPHGWARSSVGVGRVVRLDATPATGVEAKLRRVAPLVELRAPVTLRREELDAIARGALDPDLDPVIDAARAIALAEDRAVFHGYAAAQIEGIYELAAAHRRVALSDDPRELPPSVVEAVHALRSAGIAGPYALALGPRAYDELHETFTAAGYPIIEQVKEVVDGAIVWAPAIEGALVVSLRGGDFELTVGQDLSIGYRAHDADGVELYLQETFTFRCLEPRAAVPLHHG